jgi:hypothetical protein
MCLLKPLGPRAFLAWCHWARVMLGKRAVMAARAWAIRTRSACSLNVYSYVPSVFQRRWPRSGLAGSLALTSSMLVTMAIWS